MTIWIKSWPADCGYSNRSLHDLPYNRGGHFIILFNTMTFPNRRHQNRAFAIIVKIVAFKIVGLISVFTTTAAILQSPSNTWPSTSCHLKSRTSISWAMNVQPVDLPATKSEGIGVVRFVVENCYDMFSSRPKEWLSRDTEADRDYNLPGLIASF
jgi:hypothetical protein